MSHVLAGIVAFPLKPWMPGKEEETENGMPPIGMSPALVRAVTEEMSIRSRRTSIGGNVPLAPPWSVKPTLLSFVMAEKKFAYPPSFSELRTAGVTMWITRLAWGSRGSRQKIPSGLWHLKAYIVTGGRLRADRVLLGERKERRVDIIVVTARRGQRISWTLKGYKTYMIKSPPA